MKRIICVIGCLIGICFTAVGTLLITGDLTFVSNPKPYNITKTDPERISKYRFGADFYTEVSKGLYEINESLRAVNETQVSAFDAAIESVCITNNNIQSMIGLLESSFGLFVIFFFLMSFFDQKLPKKNIVQN